MVELKTPGEIEAMAAAGEVVARALAEVRKEAAVGVRTQDLDQVAREVLRGTGASSPFLGYQPSFASAPYPGVVCLSVNDAVLHGLPHDYVLRDGMTIAIEPWFMAGGRDAYRIDDDGWTLRSDDGSRGAHFEHTIAITDDQPRVLTKLT